LKLLRQARDACDPRKCPYALTANCYHDRMTELLDSRFFNFETERNGFLNSLH